MEVVKVVSIQSRKFKIARPGIGGECALWIDDFQWLTVGYDYRYTSNAGQYAFLEKIARQNMREGDTLEIDGEDKTNI